MNNSSGQPRMYLIIPSMFPIVHIRLPCLKFSAKVEAIHETRHARDFIGIDVQTRQLYVYYTSARDANTIFMIHIAWALFNTSASIANMVRKGLKAHIGAHGEPPLGLNYHAEMHFAQLGGLSNYEVGTS